MTKKIGIQGIKGSFHHQVALEYFGNTEIDECLSFERLVKNLSAGKSTQAIMAIENSIAGPIIPNYALIDKYNLNIVGEHYLQINQNLMALSGQKLMDIKEVHSHPMALLQCMDFLNEFSHIKLVEDKDTAQTAQRISELKLKNIAAIASESAAEMYDLEIISPKIQSIKNNVTRFVVLQVEKPYINPNEVSRASVKFDLGHKKGNLALILQMMADCNLNLTKIQSLPIIETPWQYNFFVDFTFDDYSFFEKAQRLLQSNTQSFKLLGQYQNTKI